MTERTLDKTTAIGKLLYPCFENVIDRLSQRTPPSEDRIRKFVGLNRRLCNNLSHLTTYAELNNVRIWREFQLQFCPAGKVSARIFTQDINKILTLLHKGGNIGRIRLATEKRKFMASSGIHVEKLLHFTSSDIAVLLSFILGSDKEEFILLFILILCSVVPSKYLLHLKVADIHKDWILASGCDGLVYGTLFEPGRTILLRYVLNAKRNTGDYVFTNLKHSAFKRWLRQQCTLAGVPNIDPQVLFYYARFICIIHGIPAYQILSVGAKNAFSPFSNPESMEDL